MRVHIVDLSGGWLFAFATQAWAWHGSLTPQSASVLQASPLFTGAGSLHAIEVIPVGAADACAVAAGALVVVPVDVAAGSLDGEVVAVGSLDGEAVAIGSTDVPPAGGDGSGGGPQAAAAKAGAPRRSVATKVQARLEEDMKNP